jgi:hypothetical protein
LVLVCNVVVDVTATSPDGMAVAEKRYHGFIVVIMCFRDRTTPPFPIRMQVPESSKMEVKWQNLEALIGKILPECGDKLRHICIDGDSECGIGDRSYRASPGDGGEDDPQTGASEICEIAALQESARTGLACEKPRNARLAHEFEEFRGRGR